MPDILSRGWDLEVFNNIDLDQALTASLAHCDAVSLLNVYLEPDDISPALGRLAKRLAEQVH
ncbi:MAG: hypothetical protein P8M30_08665 [Planctomycetaceae bacterium]|nr:hypothetical protein [Planctomycetaceae bacterium]